MFGTVSTADFVTLQQGIFEPKASPEVFSKVKDTIIGLKVAKDGQSTVFWSKRKVYYQSQHPELPAPFSIQPHSSKGAAFCTLESADISDSGKAFLYCTETKVASLKQYEIHYCHLEGKEARFKLFRFMGAQGPRLDDFFDSTRLLSKGDSFTILCRQPPVYPCCYPPKSLFTTMVNGQPPRYEIKVSNPVFSGDSVLYLSGAFLCRSLKFVDLTKPHHHRILFLEDVRRHIDAFTISDDEKSVAMLSGQSIHVWSLGEDALPTRLIDSPSIEAWPFSEDEQTIIPLSNSIFAPGISLSPLGTSVLAYDHQLWTTPTRFNVKTKQKHLLREDFDQQLHISPDENYAVWSKGKQLFMSKWPEDPSPRVVTLPGKIDDFTLANTKTVFAYCSDTIYCIPLKEESN